MTQTGLIEQILIDVGIQKESKAHSTPTLSEPLLPNEGASPFEAQWSYRSLAGKLSYLAKNTRLDIEYAVHQCARYQSNPNKSHENAIKCICRYLLKTKDQGITFTPTNHLTKVTVFVDADFCGGFNKANFDDPN